MVASVKTYTYTQTAANTMPVDANIAIDGGALTYVEVTTQNAINAGSNSVVFKKNRKILNIVNWQIVTAAGVDTLNSANAHTVTITADRLGIQVSAVTANIAVNSVIKMLLALGN